MVAQGVGMKLAPEDLVNRLLGQDLDWVAEQANAGILLQPRLEPMNSRFLEDDRKTAVLFFPGRERLGRRQFRAGVTLTIELHDAGLAFLEGDGNLERLAGNCGGGCLDLQRRRGLRGTCGSLRPGRAARVEPGVPPESPHDAQAQQDPDGSDAGGQGAPRGVFPFSH